MADQDTPQAGTPAFLNEGSTTPQPVTDSIITESDPTASETQQLKNQLVNDPSNYKTWLKLINLVQASGIDEDINKVFDDCLAVFPEDDEIWMKYAEYHLNKENRAKVEEIFKSCINMKSLKLWDLYLKKFVVKYNSLISGGRQALTNIVKAHEFALVDVGLDYNAHTLYDHELSIVESFSAINEDQNMEKKRIKLQILRKAIKGPTQKIQNYWNQYIETCPKTEIQINSADYLKVKTFVQQISNVLADLDRGYRQESSVMDNKAIAQHVIYQKWIAFEKENRLELPADLLAKRIDYVHLLSVRALRFVPEAWVDYSQFKSTLPKSGIEKENPTLGVLLKGQSANPNSFAISLTAAELYELENKTDEAKVQYERLISSLVTSYDLNLLEIQKIKTSEIEEKAKREADAKAKRKQEIENNNDDDDDQDYAPAAFTNHALPSIPHSFANASRLAKLEAANEEIGTGASLAFGSYMRFARRSLDFSETRKIFSRAKKFPGHSWHIYSASAMVEYVNNNSKVATKVYELGMKKSKFAKNLDFIMDYMSFLAKVGDQTNAKALFETSVKNFESDPSSLQKLYLEYIKIENVKQEDIRTVKTLEDRYLKKFTDVKYITAFQERFKVADFDAVKQFDYYGGFDKYALKANGSVNGGSKKRKLAQESVQDKDDEMDVDDHEPAIQVAEEIEANEPFVRDEIYNLLRILPKSSYCQPSMFDEKSLVSFLRTLDG